MATFREIIEKNASLIKYGWIAVGVLATIISTRTYLNYVSIQTAIEDVNTNITNIEEETAYTENFLLAYLESEYADYFLSHENNILFKGESIVKFKSWTGDIEEATWDTSLPKDKPATTPQQSRKEFLKEKK